MEYNSNKTHSECWFLDVGQGSANVILLGDRRAIVIDCGPRTSKVTLKFLKRYVDTIDLLVISHNDVDHDGGVADIVQAYPKAIDRIYFLKDRPTNLIRTWMVAKHEIATGNLLNAPLRLEASDKPQIIYSDSDHSIELRAIYPYFGENIEAEGARTPNRTSAILCLHCGTRTIVFSGDATMQAWECIASKLAHRLPLACDIMTIPHHGGRISHKTEHDTEYLNRLYSEIITPRSGVISAGTINQHGHPSPSTIAALRRRNIQVLCTQITPHCCSNLESIRPGLVEPTWPSQSTSLPRQTQSGKTKDVACAGTIVAQILPERVNISLLDDHQRRIALLLSSDTLHPLCKS
jgi:competence protein ComEC